MIDLIPYYKSCDIIIRDETAQHFYRKNGYTDCGSLLMNIPGFEQPMEMFLSKAL